MTDQKIKELIDFKERYKNNPVAFIEDFSGVKSLPYQKLLINSMNKIDNIKDSFIYSRINQKRWLINMQLKYMKAMEMNFYLHKAEGIDVYEKGKFVRTIERIKCNE